MTNNQNDFSNSTLNLKQAAEYLHIKSPSRLIQKVKNGEIPGSKPGKHWIFRKEKLEEYVDWLENQIREAAKVDNNGRSLCRLAKRKIVRTTLHALQSAESEYKNLREQLLEAKRSSTKKNVKEK